MADLDFKVPGPDEPGYLKRQRRAAKFGEALADAESGTDVVEELAQWLAEFIDGDPELIWEASREQINTMLEAIRAENLGDVLRGPSGEDDASSESG